MALKMNHTYDDVQEIATFLATKSPAKCKIGIICGTGLGGLADTLEDQVAVEYKDIPHFPVSTVPGHAGRLVFGTTNGKAVVCMQGRFHMYEGYHPTQITLPVRVMKLLGVEVLFVTNAAGGLNEGYQVGDMMMIKDHIFMPGLAGHNPLVGKNEERFGPRFLSLTNIYHKNLRKLATQAAQELGLEGYLKEGVFAMNGGPSYESIAECRLLKAVGADAVGMSTCPEAVVGAHCGMKVFGLSLVTNMSVLEYADERSPNHEEVIQAGKDRATDVQNFVVRMIDILPDSLSSL